MTEYKRKIRVSRRDFLKQFGALGVGLGASGLLAACGQSVAEPVVETEGESEGESQEPLNIVHFVWVGGGQGIVPREVKAEYELNNPWVTIELYEGTNAVTYPKMLAQKQASPDNPLINFGFFNSWAMNQGIRDDMWVSLDPEKIPNLNHIFDAYRMPENKGVAWGISGQGILYNPELVDEPPTSWNDILDPKWAGKVMLFDYRPTYNGLWAHAKMLGGDMEEAMPAAIDLYAEAAARGQFHSVFDTNQAVKDALARGEVLIAPYFTSFGMRWGALGEGGPFDYVIPEEGMVAFALGFEIVEGSTDRQIDVASEILNTYLSPETLSRYCNLTITPPTSRLAKLDRELALEPAFQADTIENAIQVDWDLLTAKESEWRALWDREVKANL